MKRIVYLAGFISTDYPGSIEWRERVTPVLEQAGFEVRNPLAGKGNLKCVTSDGGITTTVTSNKSIVLRDRRDVRESDLILAHLENFGSPRPLVGTIVELGWAWDDQTPVVAVAWQENDLMRKHPFISEFVSQYWETLDEAVDYIIRYYGTKSVH